MLAKIRIDVKAKTYIPSGFHVYTFTPERTFMKIFSSKHNKGQALSVLLS